MVIDDAAKKSAVELELARNDGAVVVLVGTHGRPKVARGFDQDGRVQLAVALRERDGLQLVRLWVHSLDLAKFRPVDCPVADVFHRLPHVVKDTRLLRVDLERAACLERAKHVLQQLIVLGQRELALVQQMAVPLVRREFLFKGTSVLIIKTTHRKTLNTRAGDRKGDRKGERSSGGGDLTGEL